MNGGIHRRPTIEMTASHRNRPRPRLPRALQSLLLLGAFGCAPVAGSVRPTPGALNQADTTLTVLLESDTETTYLRPESRIDFRYTPAVNLLEVTSFQLDATDVSFALGSVLRLDAFDIHIAHLSSEPSSAGFVDPGTGEVRVDASVSLAANVLTNLAPGQVVPAAGAGSITLTGAFGYDAADGSVTLRDFQGHFGPVAMRYGNTVIASIASNVTLDFEGTALPAAN